MATLGKYKILFSENEGDEELRHHFSDLMVFGSPLLRIVTSRVIVELLHRAVIQPSAQVVSQDFFAV
jgi:hypothetical protein